MYEYSDKNSWDKIAGLVFVVAIHGVLLYAAMSYKLIPPPQEAVTLFVNLINPPPQKKEEPPPEPPKPPPPKKVTLVKEKPVMRPQPAPVLVAEAPVVLAAEPVAPPPPPQPVIEAPPEPVVETPAKTTAPVQLSELSLGCPQRTPPDYPAISRRLGEQGQVKLRVELDEAGRITSARVVESSGYKRLDEAGLAAVKNWRCNAAMRDGKAVRAVALQPFDFILN
ncbi:energy transducer TonB [Methylotenera sp.]|uniref:energy transducer TonB n=1 Tax=Methylotenera sp. TaxID=2051956 RepID=UPI00272F0843|nr:energy transducer TonB [Methylotenera sp.]MDP2071155.1 energy transducer TonB [Methylotenera sp.]MDP3007318.1 energy transducer TonB [Methylotenera sp.]